VYSIFDDEGDIMLELVDFDDGMWHMHFDCSCSNEGNGVDIILYSHIGKIHNFSFRLYSHITLVVATLQFLVIWNLLCILYVRFIQQKII
jgi:hypothetical protein